MSFYRRRLVGKLKDLVVPIKDRFKFYVKKISPSEVYIDSTTYNNNNFIKFSVIADQNNDGVVSFAGVTKTVPAGTTQDVFFGIYGADSDATVGTSEGVVEFVNCTPNASNFNIAKASVKWCNCIYKILCWRSSNTAILPSMFRFQDNLKDFLIPSCITEIGSLAFTNGGMKKFQISKDITFIDKGAFEEKCDAIYKISAQNPNYKVENGAVIDKNTNTLIQAGKTTSVIPSDVTNLEYYAFKGCTNFTTIDVPANVTQIGDLAFYNSGFESIKFYSATPPTLMGASVFTSTVTLLVPSAYLSNYRTATFWSYIMDQIKGY